MQIKINNVAELRGYTVAEARLIKKSLTISNPDFIMRVERNLSLWGISSDLKYYTEFNNTLYIPSGSLFLLDQLGLKDSVSEFIDDRYSEINPWFSSFSLSSKLRDYQEVAVGIMSSKTVGCIKATTGAGKTLIMIAHTMHKKMNTLILVHTIELAEQTKRAITEHTNIPASEIGIIGDGKKVIKNITIALHQTLATSTDEFFEELNKKFSIIYADEAHICPADTFYSNLSKLTAKYKFGFSGSLFREDGLTDVIFFSIGPIIHEVPEEALAGILVKPEYLTIETGYYFPMYSSDEYGEMITHLSSDIDRNNLIISNLFSTFKDRYVCLLCSRTEQVNILKDKLGDDAVVLTSKVPKKQRKIRMDQLLRKEKRFVISTYPLFSTGIDIPHLDTLFLCAPIKSTTKIKQSAGRIMRKAPGKTKATIVDFTDNKIGLLKNHARIRKSILKK